MNFILFKGTPLSTTDCPSLACEILPRLFRRLKLLALTALAVMPQYIKIRPIHQSHLFSAASEVIDNIEDVVSKWP